jgi:hypothetical protein
MTDLAKEAEAKSWQNNEIVTIACDTQKEMDETVEYLQNNESCLDYVDNDGVMEVWGTDIDDAEYRVHVYVIDADKNRF